MATPGRASTFTRWRSRRLSEAARAALDRAPLAGDGGGAPRTVVVGLDPIRVLLFGSGPLIGYGVRTRDAAVDGALAALLAERTGRGVIIENRVRLGLPVAEAVRSLGGAGTTTFDVAIWAPRFGEELQHATGARDRSSVRAMLHAFRGTSTIPLVLCHLPTPLGNDWRTMLRRPRVAAFNRILTEEAGSMTGTTAVDIGTYRPADVSRTLGRDWHQAFAAHLAPAVLEAITAPPRRARPQRAPSSTG